MAAEVDIGRGDIVKRLVIPVMIVILYECLDLSFEILRGVVVVQKQYVLHRPVITFDLHLLQNPNQSSSSSVSTL